MGKLQINGDLILTDTSSSRIPTLTFVRGTNSDTYTDWRIQANGGNLYFQHTFNGADWTTSMQFNEETQGGTISTPYSISATGGFIGNASSASKLATARTISLTGSVTGSGSFDGSGNLSITTTTNHGHNYLPLSGGTVSGRVTFSAQDNTTNPAGQTIFLDGVSGSTDIAKAPGIGFHIGQINWGSLKFISDGSFRFYDSGCNGYMPVYASTFFGDLSGNASTASKWANARTLTLTGDTNGSVSFDGSGNMTLTSKVRDVGLVNGFQTSFRTSIIGSAAKGPFISVIRSESAISGYTSAYGTGLAFGRQDTHGYIYLNYSTNQIFVGAGSGDALQWVKQLSFSDHTHNYLPLSGGTIAATTTTDTPLAIKSGDVDAYIRFENKNGTILGYYGVNANKQPVFYQNGDKVILHSGNYNSYALPLTGGSLSGGLEIWGGALYLGSSIHLKMYYNGNYQTVIHNHDNGNISIRPIGGSLYLGYESESDIYCRKGNWKNIDAGNYSAYALPLSGGTMTKNTWNNYSNRTNATIDFGYFTNAQPSGTYYRPWMAGVIAHRAVGYGNTVVLGQFSDHYTKVGFYIGHSWDGNNSDTFHKFYRDGHFYTPRPVTSNYGSSFPSDPHTGEIFYKT